jgi:hypothetical protein
MKKEEPAKTEVLPTSTSTPTTPNLTAAQRGPTPLGGQHTTPKPTFQTKSGAKQTKWYFFCERPNFGFIHSETKKRIAAVGNYLITTDEEIANYLKTHYPTYVTEITDEMYKFSHTIQE